MSDLQTLIGKALNDENFVKKLVKDPKEALLEVGIEPTSEILDALEGIDVESIQNLAAAFGDDKAA